MNSWLDFGLWRSRRVGSPTTVDEGYRRWPEANSALSRRKQGFESPRERQLNQRLSGNFEPSVDGFSNFSPIGSFPQDYIHQIKFDGAVGLSAQIGTIRVSSEIFVELFPH